MRLSAQPRFQQLSLETRQRRPQRDGRRARRRSAVGAVGGQVDHRPRSDVQRIPSTSTMSSTCTWVEVRDHLAGRTPAAGAADGDVDPAPGSRRSAAGRARLAADQWEKTEAVSACRRTPDRRRMQRSRSVVRSQSRVRRRRHARPAPRLRSVRLGRAADGSRRGRAADGRGSPVAGSIRRSWPPVYRLASALCRPHRNLCNRSRTAFCGRSATAVVCNVCGAARRRSRYVAASERTRRRPSPRSGGRAPDTKERGRLSRPRSSDASRRHSAESSRPLCGPGTSVARTCQRCVLFCEAMRIHRRSSRRREPFRLKRCVNCATATARGKPLSADSQERERGPGPKARPSHK